MPLATDILIIGSGIAGLSLALRIAPFCKVLVVAKRSLSETNTFYAQGGIASVMDSDDAMAWHAHDTFVAGAKIGNKKIIEKVTAQGPNLIRELMRLGVPFTQQAKKLDLSLEGGHSHKRVVHAQDATGRAIQSTLIKNCRRFNSISFLENHTAIDLITTRHLKKSNQTARCHGAYVLNNLSGKVLLIQAHQTILATGGAGKTYLYTSNPDLATGDGLAMAFRAGVPLSNLEFVQFHPTCLFHPLAKSFLISEAVRGDGALLTLKDGTRFMPRYHAQAELAPRDIVARAIDTELKRRGDKHVYLDIRHKGKSFIKRKFPHLYTTCLKFGFDMTKQVLPVVPAAHYFCGGIPINEFGQTSLPDLYAIGEVSCSGLHGANRLASNSLLEGLAFANFTADKILQEKSNWLKQRTPVKSWDMKKATSSDEAVVILQNWDELRRLMWNYVGIVRSHKRLLRATTRLKILREEVATYYWNFKPTPDLIELRNICLVADVLVQSALQRQESIGLHYNIDCPHKSKHSVALNTIYPERI